MPQELYDLLIRFAQQFPLPQTPGGGVAHEEKCRSWTRRFAEQAAWTFPARDYGQKKASPTRPISKDVIAERTVPLTGWDTMLGAGTGHPTVPPKPPATINLNQQVFVPVTAQDYLGVPPPDPEPEPEPEPEPCPEPEPLPDPVSYSQFVTVEAQQVYDTYVRKHGRTPAASDLYHNAWRRLSSERWEHPAILKDI